jgi:2-oxoglutarate ferredoxin oxidoreductase subunit alpha
LRSAPLGGRDNRHCCENGAGVRHWRGGASFARPRLGREEVNKEIDAMTMAQPGPAATAKRRQEVDTVTIRFTGDSGDGMQLTGSEFTRVSALAGNDLQTFPDYPSEIRAPAGTIAGVSGFQLQFSSGAVFTSGDAPDVLVAMNPAALKSNVADLVSGGILIVNTGAFTPQNLEKAGYKANPIEDGSLAKYKVHAVDISKLSALALEGLGLSTKEVARAKNMFALGLMLWMYGRSLEPTLTYLREKFGSKPKILESNERALKAGNTYGESSEVFAVKYEVKAASIEPGTYRNISGNEAAALGIAAAAQLSGQRVFLGSYPITPATDILHELSWLKNYNVTTFQAEDEIAGICSSIGAAFGGVLAYTTTSGPGVALKQEAINLAIMAELPLVIINVQRGGPSTGLPTKTEQADLLQALYGRNGESPLPVLAASGPSDCFDVVLEATRIAIRHMTPVIVLSDGYIANGSEPWRLPTIESLAPIKIAYRTDPNDFHPYARDPETLGRQWVRPGTPGLEHRIGGLEKDAVSGCVSHEPMNHEKMVHTRAEKIDRVALSYPKLVVKGDASGGTLVLGWGSTYGAITQAVERLRGKGRKVSSLHLRHLNPLPNDLGDVLRRYDRVLVPEMNLGQLTKLVRERFLVDAKGIHKIQGKPFYVAELATRIEEHLS